MTPYDAAMAGVIVAGMVWGAFRGITWQLASMASLVLGYMVSHTLSGQLAAYFPGEPVVARALAMLTVYFGVSGGVFLTAWVIRATLRRMKFESFDRHLGMLLGGLEGAVLGLVVTLFVVSLAPQTRGPIFASPSGHVVGQLMAVLGPVLPEEARGVLAPFWAGDADPTLTAQGPIGPAPAPMPFPPAPVARGQGTQDGAVAPTSFSGLIKEEEDRVSRAIAAGAAQGVRGVIAGGQDDGTVKRR